MWDQCGFLCCSFFCRIICVFGCEGLLFLPFRVSTSDTNVVTWNILRYIPCVCLCMFSALMIAAFVPRTQCRSGAKRRKTVPFTGSPCVESPSRPPQTLLRGAHALVSCSTELARCDDWRPPPWTCLWITSSTLAARNRTTAGSSSLHTEPSPAPQSS